MPHPRQILPPPHPLQSALPARRRFLLRMVRRRRRWWLVWRHREAVAALRVGRWAVGNHGHRPTRWLLARHGRYGGYPSHCLSACHDRCGGHLQDGGRSPRRRDAPPRAEGRRPPCARPRRPTRQDSTWRTKSWLKRCSGVSWGISWGPICGQESMSECLGPTWSGIQLGMRVSEAGRLRVLQWVSAPRPWLELGFGLGSWFGFVPERSRLVLLQIPHVKRAVLRRTREGHARLAEGCGADAHRVHG